MMRVLGRRLRGVSLVELLVVLMVFGVVSALILPRLSGAVAERSVRNARAAVANLHARARVTAVQRRAPATLSVSGSRFVITVPRRTTGVDTISGVSDLGRDYGVTVTATGGPVVMAPNGLVRSGTPFTLVFARAGKADTLRLLGYGQVQ